jgi:hypothetical protein
MRSVILPQMSASRVLPLVIPAWFEKMTTLNLRKKLTTRGALLGCCTLQPGLPSTSQESQDTANASQSDPSETLRHLQASQECHPTTQV